MSKEKILITVKTYPTISQKYGETVCTAGLREDGSWVRIYPVPFRKLDEAEQYKKFDYIECNLVKNEKDYRPESFKPVVGTTFKCVGHLDTRNNWRERRNLILRRATVFTKLSELIKESQNPQKGTSLAVFKPKKIINFSFIKNDEQHDPEKIKSILTKSKQTDLFIDESWKDWFQILPPMSYKFSYKFEDVEGKSSTMRILDWEIGALLNNLRKKYDDEVCLQKIKEKYFDEFLNTDIHFFLGTTLQFQKRAPNPFMIIGVFPIPRETQLTLF